MAVTPDTELLHTIAPGLIWVSALLSILLALNNFLRPDYQDGSLTFLLLSYHPLPLLLLAKITAHWLISGLPLIIITPLLALFLHLSPNEIFTLLLALLLGTPILNLIGALAVTLTISLENSSLLLALLILPLCIPVLIFGTGVVMDVGLGLPTRGILTLLTAFLVLAITLLPLVASIVLRLGE